eukprot:CAMPEP_0197831576 /NCGR_PEP_ID=MMETSP1437-20131217/10826_1 /TAXON_ID=49252 ORGANISM="Eucampia antarctica, Strain CCMP1452" /NCGR_SAMPLE_ID=MMETSP1437 /ASSEMBLY_ACC=CAM_ASM_001096 /LENGTH=304 /DNA_ID=CAMNT_0043434545 /DNA_START=42 /DNA_END=956 /DNA_ORIENTATION=+
MTEPDELYTLRAQFWLGHYSLCLEEVKALIRRPMPPHLKAEREEIAARALLAMGEYDKVIREGDGPTKSPAMQVLALYAKYLSTSDVATRESIVESLQKMTNNPSSSPSFQLTASHLFLAADKTREALQCIYLGTTMEHLSSCVQIYIKIDRLDLAKDCLNLMKQADEDAILTQLSGVHYNIAQGRSTANDAIHTLMSLTEQYGPNTLLLNVSAVAHMVAENYEAAEAALQTAITDFQADDNVDTLINLAVCGQHMGKGVDKEIIHKLRTGHAYHPFVQGLVRVEGALEREAVKYKTVEYKETA